MATFNFDIKPCFPHRITKFSPDMLTALKIQNTEITSEALARIGCIIDKFGVMSACAQNIASPMTSFDSFMTKHDQTIYMLADVNAPSPTPNAVFLVNAPNHSSGGDGTIYNYRSALGGFNAMRIGGNGNDGGGDGTSIDRIVENPPLPGVVQGFLKIGYKDLYLFNEHHLLKHCKRTPAILDFYVHSNCQRRGYGKLLFDQMLADTQLQPCKFVVDRPSEKMLNFLKKNYSLEMAIPQGINFVVYQGFFEKDEEDDRMIDDEPPKPLLLQPAHLTLQTQQAQILKAPPTQGNYDPILGKLQSPPNYWPGNNTPQPTGRYGARRVANTRNRIFQS